MMRIPTPELFNWRECLWFLDRRYDDCLYHIEGLSVQKALVLDGQPLLIKISERKGALHIDLLRGEGVGETAIRNYVEDWFDLDRDLAAFYGLLERNPRLSYMAEDFRGLRLVGIPDLFEAMSWCIIGQQINLSFAHKVKRSLVETYGDSITHGSVRHFIFPKAEVLAGLSVDELKALQFSRQKAEYLITLASAFAAGSLSKQQLLALPDAASRLKSLTALRGIGIWTANYALMKSLRDPTCIPYGDVGLLNALSAHELMADRKDMEALHSFFQGFTGWQSYMVFYLWRSLSPPPIQ